VKDKSSLESQLSNMYVEFGLNVKKEFLMYQIFIVNNFIEYYKMPSDKSDLNSIFETDKYLKSVSADQRDFTS
jgi:hypothetical protein